ncbi:MAG: dihydroorotase [Candidatus Baltobacteraceae bacterium]
MNALLDLRLREGRIVETGADLSARDGEETIDACGAYVAPGFIDMHVHLREPGNPEKETLRSGTAAAVAGGFTAVAAMPNTNPPMDSAQIVRACSYRKPVEGSASCRVYPIAALTRGREGGELLDYAALKRAGAVAFSDDGSTVMNARVLYDAAAAARRVQGCFIVHCEDADLKGDAARNTPANRLAEDTIVARDVAIAQETGKAWHIAHVSTRGALDAVVQARASGTSITCEVTPHHLVFTDNAVDELGSRAKVNPPLRSQADVDALRAGVMNGAIDVFACDHAPHTEEEKTAALDCGAVGFSGLEIAAAAYAYALPALPVSRFVEMISCNPARILNVPGGTLKPGSPADVTIFAERAWKVDPDSFRSKGKSTPFAGMMLPRKVLVTIVEGMVKYRNA